LLINRVVSLWNSLPEAVVGYVFVLFGFSVLR